MSGYKYTKKKRSQIAENCPCGRSNHDGKFTPFDGHRKKDKNPIVPSGYTRNSGYIPCLFGLHQLNPKYGDKKPIALVESEKSACLGFHAFKKFNFIALGGSRNRSVEARLKRIGKEIVEKLYDKKYIEQCIAGASEEKT